MGNYFIFFPFSYTEKKQNAFIRIFCAPKKCKGVLLKNFYLFEVLFYILFHTPKRNKMRLYIFHILFIRIKNTRYTNIDKPTKRHTATITRCINQGLLYSASLQGSSRGGLGTRPKVSPTPFWYFFGARKSTYIRTYKSTYSKESTKNFLCKTPFSYFSVFKSSEYTTLFDTPRSRATAFIASLSLIPSRRYFS